MKTVIIQLIGLLAVILFISSIQFKEKKTILLFQFYANTLYLVEYALLGAFSASAMNIISAVRCYIFRNFDIKKKKIPTFYLITFIVLIIFFGLISYDNVLSLIPIIITSAYIISSFCKGTYVIRIIYFICSILWLFFNIKVGAYACAAGNVLEFISGFISLLKYRKKHIN